VDVELLFDVLPSLTVDSNIDLYLDAVKQMLFRVKSYCARLNQPRFYVVHLCLTTVCHRNEVIQSWEKNTGDMQTSSTTSTSSSSVQLIPNESFTSAFCIQEFSASSITSILNSHALSWIFSQTEPLCDKFVRLLANNNLELMMISNRIVNGRKLIAEIGVAVCTDCFYIISYILITPRLLFLTGWGYLDGEGELE